MSTSYAALGYRFTVACTDELLQAHVDSVLSGLAIPDHGHAGPAPPPARFTVDTARRAGPSPPRRGGPPRAAGPLAHLLHQVNLRAVEHSDHLTLLHAAAACAPSGPVVLPAAMECGKSTLVTALALRGWPYVTDEVAAVGPSGDLVPYPRAISLDPGSWALFPDLQPDVDPRIAELLPTQWQVSVPAAGGTVATSPGAPVAVVVPSYRPDEPTRLGPITALDGLRHLLEATFRLERSPERDLRALAAIVTGVPCYRLVVSSLEQACRLLESEFGAFETQTTAIDDPRPLIGVGHTRRK